MHDVLAEILTMLQLRAMVYCQSEIHKSAWALQFHHTHHAVFHIVGEGECYLTIDEQNIWLQRGDLLILPHGDAHRIADQPDSPCCADIDLNQQVHSCLMMRWGDDQPKTTLVCGLFTFDEFHRHTIVTLLPTIIHFKYNTTIQYGLNLVVEALLDEANHQRQGKNLLLHRLADILFVQVLRAWLIEPYHQTTGWLGGLRHPQIALALSAIHADPADEWTVEKLAVIAMMSRSAFAAKFTELVGIPPLTYVTYWRMQLATTMLKDERLSVSQIAEKVGYTSDIAFHKAFKRQFGYTPAMYRRTYLKPTTPV